MKTLLSSIAVAVSLASSANAANFIVANAVTGLGSSDALFEDTDGSLLSGGIVTIGYFTPGFTPSSDLGDISTTIANFNIQASEIAGTGNALLGSSRAGYVQGGSVSGPNISAPSVLLGESVFVFVGNAATLETSTAFALKAVAVIQDDFPLENDYNANPLGGEAPVIGSTDTFTGDATGFGSDTYETLKLEAIPEPSAAILGGLGALLMLRRRRND